MGGKEMSEWVVKVEERMPNYVYKHGREEIVRCRSCKHYILYRDDEKNGLYSTCSYFGIECVPSNGFCAWGEVKSR